MPRKVPVSCDCRLPLRGTETWRAVGVGMAERATRLGGSRGNGGLLKLAVEKKDWWSISRMAEGAPASVAPRGTSEFDIAGMGGGSLKWGSGKRAICHGRECLRPGEVRRLRVRAPGITMRTVTSI